MRIFVPGAWEGGRGRRSSKQPEVSEGRGREEGKGQRGENKARLPTQGGALSTARRGARLPQAGRGGKSCKEKKVLRDVEARGAVLMTKKIGSEKGTARLTTVAGEHAYTGRARPPSIRKGEATPVPRRNGDENHSKEMNPVKDWGRGERR